MQQGLYSKGHIPQNPLAEVSNSFRLFHSNYNTMVTSQLSLATDLEVYWCRIKSLMKPSLLKLNSMLSLQCYEKNNLSSVANPSFGGERSTTHNVMGVATTLNTFPCTIATVQLESEVKNFCSQQCYPACLSSAASSSSSFYSVLSA